MNENDTAPSHPRKIRPQDHASWNPEKMGKSTIFHSKQMLLGVNALEPGQMHSLHAHEGIDKVYLVIEGAGMFLLEHEEFEMVPGELLVAPADVPHGVRNDSKNRLIVLTFLAPGPPPKG